MENSMQKHIQNESDLDYYENYLNENFRDTRRNTEEMSECREMTPAQMPKMQIENRRMTAKQNTSMTPRVLASDVFSNGYLQNHRGKLVKVESLIGNTLDCRIGILLDIGADYIAIKLNKSCCSMMIPTMSIKYITIIHDNDISKAFTY